MAVISIKNKIKSGSLLVGNGPFIPTDYESIETVTVGSGGSSSVSFTSIPSTYQHLQIRGIARSSDAGADDNIYATLNGVTGTSYSWHRMYADGSVINVGSVANTGASPITLISGAGAAANIFGAFVIDILDYKDTNKNRTVRGIGGDDRNGGGYVSLQSFAFYNTTAVSSITLTSSANFTQYSSFALYGIK